MNKTLGNLKSRDSLLPFRGVPSRSFVDDLFDHYLGNAGAELASFKNASMDVAETDHSFEIKLDLPGVARDDVDIQIDNNTLTIRGHRTSESEEGGQGKQFHRIERYSGSFARSVVLPNAIDDKGATAEFKDGVLKIVIPKAESAKARKISIS